ncbi:MAG: hypothetical protein KF773_27555 [Deltaproteobacteria bacterium]|nr:hypothetical protein [Deltaproteobacteria bacterium]MCW5803195.1 hypothetical protein [Deltaproteobacteria bacterium]
MTIKRCLLLPLLVVMLAGGTARADDASRKRFAQKQEMLSRLWVFATLNYLYCDVVGLMDAKMLKQYGEGIVDGVRIDEGFLLGATILMQVPLSMVFLSTALPPRASRVANIAAGALMTGVQTATLFIGRPAKYYLFSSAVEIATTGFITAYALLAMKPPRVVPSVGATQDAVTMSVGFRF